MTTNDYPVGINDESSFEAALLEKTRDCELVGDFYAINCS